MFCPLCVSEQLEMTFRSGIEVDVCPRCRGVWLDRGELDRLAEGTVETPPPPRASDQVRPVPTPQSPPQGWSQPQRPEKPRSKKHRRRKKGFDDRLEDLFEELFDVFD